MLRAYTGQAVRAAEQPLLEAGHGAALMEKAAHGLAMAALSVLRERRGRVYGAAVSLLVGSGNNGGDALFAGAQLCARGVQVTAYLCGSRVHTEGLSAFSRAGGRVRRVDEAAGALAAEAGAADLLVDALLGTGGRGGLRGAAAALVAGLLAQADRGPVVACDLPSGVDPGTGRVHEPVLPARLTVTFGAYKAGLFLMPAAQLCGEVRLVELGLAPFLGRPDLLRLENTDIAELLPRAEFSAHKYTRGVAGIVAGSAQYPGAALLAVAAASACGPGMVRYAGPASIAAFLAVRNPEVVSSSAAPDSLQVQAWLAGSGIDGSDEQAARARQVLASGLPAVVDAGALPLVGFVKARNERLVLTPHAGELAGLLARFEAHQEQTSSQETAAPAAVPANRAAIEARPLAAVRRAAYLTGAVVLLKGAATLVATPDGTVYSQGNGRASLATAGSGDTLAGILVALLAMRSPADPDGLAQTAALAAALHGELAQMSQGEPLNAGALAARIPETWAALAANAR